MKSLALKIGLSLLVLYGTGWIWLPRKAVIVLYTFDSGLISAGLKSASASDFAKAHCLNNPSVKNADEFNRCWDDARSDYYARSK